MVFPDKCCKKCGKEYTNNKWCKPCHLKNSRNFTNWTGNKKIDSFIQEIQSKTNNYAFEWIPYNQFNDIKETKKEDFNIIYSATWKDGLLRYDRYREEWKRIPDCEVILKCSHNSQNAIDEFLNEV